jgi:purine-nucleoside phosphorylase
MPEKYIAGNAGCLSDLENFMKGLEAPHKVGSGRVFTIGSILSESPGFLMALKDKGIAAIDMEISAVYTAAREAGIRASALLVVSDLPLEKGIEEGLDLEAKKVFNNSVRAMSDAVLDFIVRQ